MDLSSKTTTTLTMFVATAALFTLYQKKAKEAKSSLQTLKLSLGSVAVYPSPLQILPFFCFYPKDQPFVMINLLSFKEKATGQRHVGLTGEQAYLKYAKSAGQFFRQVSGSVQPKVLWNGKVVSMTAGTSSNASNNAEGCSFDVAASVEWPNISIFRQYSSSPIPDMEARKNGLNGQWLICSTTTTTTTSAETKTPNDGETLFELTSYKDDDSSKYHSSSLTTEHDSFRRNAGCIILWSGKCQNHLIGDSAAVPYHQATVTWFPNKETLDKDFNDFSSSDPPPHVRQTLRLRVQTMPSII